MKNSKTRGFLLIMVIVFGSVFFLIISSFVTFIVSQYQVQVLYEEEQRARNIAEAGLNYYRWFLAHNPNDVTNGTATSGPYIHPYNDPEGGTIGEFSLSIASSTACGEVQAIDILSTGHTTTSPNVQRTLYGRYARPTVSEYAYIINSNVWVGSDHDILGPYHSNGIIRMDGTNNSTVTSGQETWVCDGSLSCSPGAVGSTVNAVYGNGPNSNLWTYPSPPINFLSLTVDLANMKSRAQNNGGVYIGPSADQGYLIEFRNDGRFDVYIVDRTWSHNEYSTESGWYTAYNLIREADFLATYDIPDACSLIYIEDKVWLRGVVEGKVTLAAADVDTVGVDPSIILHGNITYNTATSGLLAIAEDDVLVGYDVPDSMTLNGIFIAQNGKFGRNHYTTSVNGGDRYRTSLTINGTIVSNGRVGTKWTSGGVWTSGFNDRYTSYDRNLVANPPPLTPEVSDVYEFIEWREMD